MTGRDDTPKATGGEERQNGIPTFSVLPFSSTPKNVRKETSRLTEVSNSEEQPESASDGSGWLPEGVEQEQPESTPEWGRSAAAILREGVPTPDWLIPGVLARGWSLEVNGREKEGKGQLITSLLGSLERGEVTAFGPSGAATTSLIYTEEPEDTLGTKLLDARLSESLVVLHHELTWAGRWHDRWPLLLQRCIDAGHGVLFIDNVSRATGTEEEAGVELARHVEPLLTEAKKHGVAVILDRHQRKSGGKVEDLSRGGTALGGAVDVILVLQRHGSYTSRARKLHARGRLESTRWVKVVELSEDRTRYTEATAGGLDVDIRDAALPTAEEWTVKAFSDATGYDSSTARRWLKDSPRTEQIKGTGGRGVPLRFRVLPAPPELD